MLAFPTDSSFHARTPAVISFIRDLKAVATRFGFSMNAAPASPISARPGFAGSQVQEKLLKDSYGRRG